MTENHDEGHSMTEADQQYPRFVTWRELLVWGVPLVLTCMFAIGGGVWGLFNWSMQVHSRQPHAGAVTTREFERAITAFEQMDVRQEKRVERLEGKIDKLIELRIEGK